MARFLSNFKDRELTALSTEECLDFLGTLTDGNKQTTKRNRFSILSTFFAFTRDSLEPTLKNPCDAPVFHKLFRNPRRINWKILDKDIVDEIIFRTLNVRNRLILELMARAGMRVGEVLKLTPEDMQGQKVALKAPKSGREDEVVYLPQKLTDKLHEYITDKNITVDQRIFPITYISAWQIVRKAGMLVGVGVSPHDFRRYAATYASRSGIPLEIVSKVILRHANISTTQRYLGRVSDREATRWIENLYG